MEIVTDQRPFLIIILEFYFPVISTTVIFCPYICGRVSGVLFYVAVSYVFKSSVYDRGQILFLLFVLVLI